ncbi:amidase family protein [Microbacterium maritypicum]|jgi:amidase|nr:amidase family protein [Microbacterium liquefaciens]
MHNSNRHRRRGFVALMAVACLAAPLTACTVGVKAPEPGADMSTFLDEMTIPELQHAMDEEELDAEALTQAYLDRIEKLNPTLHAIVQTNPDALDLAQESDERRRSDESRGPLEGIPVLLKENMDTADAQRTTAGSTALAGSKPAQDAFLVQRLREAGAIILGKTNMSEWANFYSSKQPAGWSAVGGQTRNPYDRERTPCGSSSGAAVAAAAALATVSIGTDTDGSITCPAASASTVGVKPTLGVVSRSGVIPITSKHDSPGPIARTVTDAAITLQVIAGHDDADADSVDGRLPQDLDDLLDQGALHGSRIGVWREGHEGVDDEADDAFDMSVEVLRGLGATVIEGADVPDIESLVPTDLLPAVLTEFKHDLNRYLETTPGDHPRSLTELIAYNQEHADVELPIPLEQDYFVMADRTDGNVEDPEYRAHREMVATRAQESVDDVLRKHDLDAIVTISDLPAASLQAQKPPSFQSSTRNTSLAGYPNITVPSAFTDSGLPIGLTFIGTRLSDASLLSFAYAYEQATGARRAPAL